jgi:gliding motility-associated protein GldM
MGAKNCPETPRQKMINMMYIVLTAMLALNVAAEVLEAFRVVDSSLTQTIKTVEMKNTQVYSSFNQAYAENPARVGTWKEKSDQVKEKTEALITEIWKLKQDLVLASGGVKIGGSVKLRPDDPIFENQAGDTIKIKKEDDLNTPSEMMITQNKASDLKKKIIAYKEFLAGMISDDNPQLKEAIAQELDTSDPPAKKREGGEKWSWETQRFDSKPLIAVITLLSKIQIDVRNAESHMIGYLFSQIDAGSFKFNKLGARVIANSNVVLQGDEYVAEIFLGAEDTTQSPEIFVNNQKLQMSGGKGIYRASANSIGPFKFSGIIKYKKPDGIFQNIPFEQTYQVTAPGITLSATGMNVFYKGIKNPIDFGVGGLPKENIRLEMTNGRIEHEGSNYYVLPDELDESKKNTTITLYATIGSTERKMGTTVWRVKRVPDPEAQIAGMSGGDIQKSRLQVEDGLIAVLKDFDFDFRYTVTQFTVNVTNSQGYTNPFISNSNRFTSEQKDQFRRLSPGMFFYIDNIKARGDDNSIRPLKPISFKIQ